MKLDCAIEFKPCRWGIESPTVFPGDVLSNNGVLWLVVKSSQSCAKVVTVTVAQLNDEEKQFNIFDQGFSISASPAYNEPGGSLQLVGRINAKRIISSGQVFVKRAAPAPESEPKPEAEPLLKLTIHDESEGVESASVAPRVEKPSSIEEDVAAATAKLLSDLG
jgi:hypothetical protein